MSSIRSESRAMDSQGCANGRTPGAERIRRWDGAAGSCTEWDSLRKDPDLWFRSGNCHVHLYGKGQSRRGPSFKVPFTDLLAANCHPLIHRFLSFDGPDAPRPNDLDGWNRANPRRVVDLYIPPPSMADKTQAFHYHLATRNFFAWVFRRSMVGEHLGGALVCLLHSMHEFRLGTEDNVEDMMDYLDEEGYLDLADRPDHALAVLHLAEFFHLKELYTRAFAHCVGMSRYIFTSTEYWSIGLSSKKAIRKAKQDLDSRINKATDMLSDFLDEELSESKLGIPSGARAHLERFRSFLLSFYSAQLGYYPAHAFGPELLASMRDDFKALYELLVDDAYTASEIMPTVAAGGICTLQLIQAFDAQHRYEPLDHPLPLLPEFVQRGLTRRLRWLPRSDRIKPEQRFLAHAALIKASNWRESIFKNELVRSYRQFEELSVVAPNKADKQEVVSLMDARKMRWILVYATYQVLRSVTQTPPEVREDYQVLYHMAVKTDDLPPWKNRKETSTVKPLLRTQTDLATMVESPLVIWDHSGLENAHGKIELKPDIDYFALTHKAPSTKSERRGSMPVLYSLDNAPPVPDRTSSLSRALSRSSLRRSMRMFKAAPLSMSPSVGATLHAKPSYHEIVVHGYGNGTNDVNFSSDEESGERDGGVSRSGSTGSGSDTGAESGPESMVSSADTVDTSDTADSPVTTEAPRTPFSDDYAEIEIKPLRPRRRSVVSLMMPTSLTRAASTPRRPVSTICEANKSYSDPYTQLVEEQRANIFGSEPAPVPPPRAPSRHSMRVSDLKRWSHAAATAALPPPHVHIVQGEEEEWAAMQAFMDGGDGRVEMVDDDVKPAWEQYSDLGGLTEARWI